MRSGKAQSFIQSIAENVSILGSTSRKFLVSITPLYEIGNWNKVVFDLTYSPVISPSRLAKIIPKKLFSDTGPYMTNEWSNKIEMSSIKQIFSIKHDWIWPISEDTVCVQK